ncbi:MAG: phosphatase PAP2 family protein [Clostridia bacterium]|nr:phosphatase PAP2 family protein [Clostridia bacterium]
MDAFFDFLYPFDNAILNFMNTLNMSAGAFFTPLAKLFTFLGEGGILYFLTAFILAFFKRTRKIAVCIFGSVCCGALVTNVILKDAVARLRPFEASSTFNEFWVMVGSPFEDGFSFPSGHATSVMAFSTALFLTCNKKWSFVGFIGVIIMAFSRVYLMAHYPSDVIMGIIVGGVSGLIAYAITILIFKFLYKHYENKVCKFLIDFDVIKIFKK